MTVGRGHRGGLADIGVCDGGGLKTSLHLLNPSPGLQTAGAQLHSLVARCRRVVSVN